MHVRNSRLFHVRWRAGLSSARLTAPLRRVRWRLLPRAASRLAGWAWVLPFAALGWLVGVGVYAARSAWEAVRQGYWAGRKKV